MAGYISEVQYYGDSSQEFIEVAFPTGTDTSGYRLTLYDGDGNPYGWIGLGDAVTTIDGQDVYLVDVEDWGSGTGDAQMGVLWPETAIALSDGNGNVDQFISSWGNTTTAQSGPAAGMTSTDIGTAGQNESMQSDDGGQTYYRQTSTNKGSIPACYGAGTLIGTPHGPRPAEAIRPGEKVLGDTGEVEVVWTRARHYDLRTAPEDLKPVLIKAGALGPGRPARDMTVSAQHRIVAGRPDQLPGLDAPPSLVPAKALLGLPGVRVMAGKREITWYHLLCREHAVLRAEAVLSESLLPGPVFMAGLTRRERLGLLAALDTPGGLERARIPALPCLGSGEARRRLSWRLRPGRAVAC